MQTQWIYQKSGFKQCLVYYQDQYKTGCAQVINRNETDLNNL